MKNTTKPDQTAFGGFFNRRVAWRLSRRGWAVALLLALAIITLLFLGAYPFLAPTVRLPSELLLVEGWMPHYTMKQVAEEFRAHQYQRILLVCPIVDLDDKYESGKDEGENLAALLVKYQVPASKISMLYPFVAKKDRTYHSALVVKEWLADQKMSVKAFDVMTLGPHARRSRLLYQIAFTNQAEIGIIAAEDMQYDPHRWWIASEGVREILSETTAYLYAKLFFRISS